VSSYLARRPAKISISTAGTQHGGRQGLAGVAGFRIVTGMQRPPKTRPAQAACAAQGLRVRGDTLYSR
jgi:hypothetical protein